MTVIGSYVADACAVTDWKTVGRSWMRRHLAWICAPLVITGMCAAVAEERQTITVSEPIGFHIPAQSLAGALQAYGERTGVQVLYESNSATGRKSAAVEGNFTAEQALNLLLAGTDLKVQYTRPDAITLAPPSATADRPPASLFGSADLSLGTLRVRASNDGDDVGRLHDYTETLQIDIQKALQKHVRTRGGNYRAVLDLWIDRSRTVQRTEVFKSTGDVERDTAVAAVLRGLTISRSAPANTPQPVRIVIVVKSL